MQKEFVKIGLEELHFSKMYSSTNKKYPLIAIYSFVNKTLRVLMDGNTTIKRKEFDFAEDWAENIIEVLKDKNIIDYKDYVKSLERVRFLKLKGDRYSDVTLKDIK